MSPSATITKKPIVRLLVSILNPLFEELSLEFVKQGIQLRGMDAARIILLNGVISDSAFASYTPEAGAHITLDGRELREFLQGVSGPFDEPGSTLSVSLGKRGLDVHFRHEATIARSKTFRGVSDEQIVVPRFQGLSGAAICRLNEPWRLGFVSQTFSEREADLILGVSKEKFKVSTSKEDYLDLPGSGSGEAETTVHRSLFEVLHPVCGQDLAVTSCEASIVRDGVARFAMALGRAAELTYYAAPTVKED